MAYANERVVFGGRPIGQNQGGIAFPLAESHLRLRAAELMIRDASYRYDAGLPCGEQANAAEYPPPTRPTTPPIARCRRSEAWAMRRSTTSSATGARPGLIRIAPISQEMILNYVSEHVLGLPRSY